MGEKEKILLIIPAYNEEENILKTYTDIIEFNLQHGTNYDVIVINDGSRDHTGAICAENSIPTVNLIGNLGIGGAVQTGYKYALKHGYDIAVQYDGDGQHDVAYVESIVNPIIEEICDFSIGSRFIDAGSSEFKSTASRRVGINLISFFIKLFTSKKVYDTTSGFRACNKEIIKIFADDYPTEYPEPITTLVLLKRKYKLSEIPVKMNERTGGVSSIRAWKNIYYMLNVLLSITVSGLRRYK